MVLVVALSGCTGQDGKASAGTEQKSSLQPIANVTTSFGFDVNLTVDGIPGGGLAGGDGGTNCLKVSGPVHYSVDAVATWVPQSSLDSQLEMRITDKEGVKASNTSASPLRAHVGADVTKLLWVGIYASQTGAAAKQVVQLHVDVKVASGEPAGAGPGDFFRSLESCSR